MKLSDAEIASLLLDEQASDPATPAAGFWRVYAKADGLYIIDDAGAVTGPFGAADLAAHLADASDAHDASAVSYDNTTSGLAATDVQAAVDEVAASGGGSGTAQAAKVTQSSAQTISAATTTALAFNTEDEDTDGFHDNATNNTRLTVPAGLGGLYLVGAVWGVNSALGDGKRITLHIAKNGTTITGSPVESNAASTSERVNVTTTTIIRLAATDYIEAMAWQGATASRDTDTARTALWCLRIGD